MCTVVALEKFKIRSVRGYQVVQKHHFCLFLRFFVFSFSFPHLTHVIFGLQLVQSIFLHMCTVVAPGKIQNQGLLWGIRGYKNTIFSHFCLFFEIFCLSFQFPTLESCYIWFTISLGYSSAYVYSCCPGKIQSQGLSGGIRGYKNTILSQFCLFLRFFVFFFCFPHWNHVLFGLQLSLIHI